MRDHGGQLETLAQKLGVTLPSAAIHDFSASLNPLGMPPALSRIGDIWTNLATCYPSTDAQLACAHIALAHGLQTEQVLCGNGSTELMALALQASQARSLHCFSPCWSGYAEAAAAAGIATLHIAAPAHYDPLDPRDNALMEAHIRANFPQEPHCAVMLASPNNPNGCILSAEFIRSLCTEYPETLVLLDLAFDDFLHDPGHSPWWQGADWPGNLVRIQSLTKFFAIAGLRLGFLATGNDLPALELAARLRKRALPWSVNGIAQWVGERLYSDPAWNDLARTECQSLRDALLGILHDANIRTTPCAAWVLAEPPVRQSATEWQRELLQKGICVRLLRGVGLQGCDLLRFGLLGRGALDALDNALRMDLISIRIHARPMALLIAGTTSDAGKSAVATGVCAALRARGLKPMPYKAQNMSNHAWVTPEGGEIGWAQAVQAFAAGVTPHVDMNPVLLKPGNQGCSHVIHRGRDIGAMDVHAYHAGFVKHRQIACDAYDALSAKAGSMVLEGAGGIAEINLRHRDLSNREAPLHANAGIVIVGDIDRGGVFASLLGSVQCLDAQLRSKVLGFVINRFRGDASLLDSGIQELQVRTGIPTLGVIPWRSDLHLGEEDSLNLGEQELPPASFVRIGVVRLPHLCNVNDWSSLEHLPGVALFRSQDPAKLAQADALILPGTRTTISDLRWLKEQGLDTLLTSWTKAQKPLLAICGGLQILGERVIDPDGVEEAGGAEESGLGIFAHTTVLQAQGKVVRPRQGFIHPHAVQKIPWLAGVKRISGYEIHCGQTRKSQMSESHSIPCIPWAMDDDGCAEGWIAGQGTLWATYWHGALHSEQLAHAWIRFVAERAGKLLCVNSIDNSDDFAVPSFLKPGIRVAHEMVETSFFPGLITLLGK